MDNYKKILSSLDTFEKALESVIESVNEARLDQLFTLSSKDAYSYDAFGEDEWRETCEYLLTKFNLEDSYKILCSKLTRWCRDHYSHDNEGKAEYVKKYVEDSTDKEIQYFLT